MQLNKIIKNRKYKIKKINANSLEKIRLNDLGILNDASIQLLYVSPSKRIKAYLVKNSIISIRNKDASLIEVYND